MRRRALFQALGAAGLGLIASWRAKAEGTVAPNAVYHLVDAEKATFVFGNLRNHRIGVGDAGHVQLAVVVHGPALSAFRRAGPNHALAEDLGEALKAGVVFFACSFTLAAKKWTLDDLLPGFVIAEKGGVVKLAELQGLGWAYLRP